MNEAISSGPEAKVIFDSTEATPADGPALEKTPADAPAPKAEAQALSVADSADSADSFNVINKEDFKTPATEVANPVPESDSTAVAPAKAAAPAQPEQSGVKIDLSQLIAPEVWADLLPIRVKSGIIEDTNAGSLAAAATLFPAPPKDDATSFLTVDNTRLTIHAAVCGIHDVTASLCGQVVENTTITIKPSEIDALARSPVYDSLPQPFAKNLSLVYSYGDGPLRFVSANADANSSNSVLITAKSEHPQLTPRAWNNESWSIVAAVYGGKLYADDSKTKIVEDAVKKDFNESTKGERRVWFNNSTFGEDPRAGVVKTGVVYYRAEDGAKGVIRTAVGVEGKDPAALTLTPQIAALEKIVDREVVREVEVPKEVIKEVIKEVPREVIKEVQVPSPASRNVVMFDRDRLRVQGSETPFLRFENGVKFKFQPDGNFVAYYSNGACAWATDKTRGVGENRELVWQGDGNFVAYAGGEAIWSSDTWNTGSTLVMASEKPFVQVLNSGGGSVWSSW